MDETKTYDALAALALAGLSAGVHAMRLLASRGLVSPAEVEEYADSLTAHFEVPEGHPSKAHLAQFRDRIEANISPALAEIRRYAANRWIGDKPDRP